MFFEFIWTMALISLINLGLLIMAIAKLKKQEIFQTGEAHANLELINQSLNRLSEIAEKLEHVDEKAGIGRSGKLQSDYSRPGHSKEQRALLMIRQGEDPRKIGRMLGISKSEIDLLTASEKLGGSRRNIRAGLATQ